MLVAGTHVKLALARGVVRWAKQTARPPFRQHSNVTTPSTMPSSCVVASLSLSVEIFAAVYSDRHSRRVLASRRFSRSPLA